MKIRKIAPNEDLETTVKKKRNRFKFVLIAIIVLSAAGFLGFKYFTPKKEAICLGTDTKIYDAYKDAVVLIKHRYGYFAKINGKEIQLNVEDAKEETIYGTGFFVDTEGDMITNRHVLQPWDSSDEESAKVNTTIRNLRMKVASILTTDVSENDYESFIDNNWSHASVSYDEGEGDGEYEESGEETTESAGEEFVSSNETETDTAQVSTDIASIYSGKRICAYRKH
ncbi:hypothetical protein [Flavobacterium ginsengisoli]|uniref:hypothetical protein n=1 Tax=Flavobacterium ginsengisoli TaxID=871694 RepID=UPI002414E316|nr:hypothetical protein [Flavobacterium ginsengisoli]